MDVVVRLGIEDQRTKERRGSLTDVHHKNGKKNKPLVLLTKQNNQECDSGIINNMPKM